ncbi:MAG: thioredoxin family protein [Planctomycetaceae bacterium]|nr:thioredoxin family protein [Planctomycetaceae bacterium]
MYRLSQFGFASASGRMSVVEILLSGVCLISMGWAGEEETTKFNRVLKLGAEAPVWEGLLETGGSKLGLVDFKEQRAVVLFFTRNHCPMTGKYAQRIRDLSREFSDQGVVFVGVNGSRKPDVDLQSMQKTRERLGWEFPYLKDPSGELASKYGATVTPQFFLIDGSRRVVYMGALDDHPDVKKVQEPYLRWGIEQVLAGKEVEIAESLPLGCQIEEEESEKD